MVQPYYSPTGNLRDDFYLRYGVYPTPMTDTRTGMMNIAQDALQAGKFAGQMLIPQDMTDIGLMVAAMTATGPAGLLATPMRRAALGGAMMALDPDDATAGPRKVLSQADALYRSGLSDLRKRQLQQSRGATPPPATQTTEQFYQPGMSYQDMLQSAQRGGHLHPTRTGSIAGAPNTFSRPSDIEAARRSSDALAARGAAYRFWYDDGAKAIDDYSPTENARLALASGMGRMSPNSSPDFATENTVRMMGNLASGGDARTFGMPRDSARFVGQFQQAAQGVPTAPGMTLTLDPIDTYGRKTGPYTVDLLTGGKDPRTVNDLWRGRAQGYPAGPNEGSFGAAQHNYMWGEGVLASDRANALALGGATDWNPARYQAAEWVGARARAEMAERDARIARINADEKMKAETKRKLILAEKTDAEILASANEPIGNTLERRAVNVTYEAIPGRGLGHLEGIIDAPEASRAAFSAPRLDVFTTRGGEAPGVKPGYDMLYTGLGMPQRPVQSAVGQYTAPGSSIVERNPVQVAGPVMSITGGGSQPLPHDLRMLDAVETLRGGLLGQHAVGYNRSIPIDRKRASAEASGLLYEGADPAGAVRAFENAGLHAVDVGGGRVTAGRFYDPVPPREILAAADAAQAQGYASRPALYTSGLLEPPGREPGAVTANIASKFGGDDGRRMSEALDSFVRPIASQLRALDSSVEGFGPVSDTLQKLREVLGSEGLAKLVQATSGMPRDEAIRYYASRGLPAIGAAVLASREE